MAETSTRVMNMVRRRILENPGVTNEELFAAAVEIEPDLRNLNLRQFNARYPLQVRRWELSDRANRREPERPAFPWAPRPPPQSEPAPRAEGASSGNSLMRSESNELRLPGTDAPAQPKAKPRKKRAARAASAAQAEATQPVTEAGRRQVRQTLLRFAESVARAGSIPDAIQAVAHVDDVVDEIVGVFVEKG